MFKGFFPFPRMGKFNKFYRSFLGVLADFVYRNFKKK